MFQLRRLVYGSLSILPSLPNRAARRAQTAETGPFSHARRSDQPQIAAADRETPVFFLHPPTGQPWLSGREVSVPTLPASACSPILRSTRVPVEGSTRLMCNATQQPLVDQSLTSLRRIRRYVHGRIANLPVSTMKILRRANRPSPQHTQLILTSRPSCRPPKAWPPPRGSARPSRGKTSRSCHTRPHTLPRRARTSTMA